MHREGTDRCGTECLEYTTKRKSGLSGDKTSIVCVREGTVYIEVS